MQLRQARDRLSVPATAREAEPGDAVTVDEFEGEMMRQNLLLISAAVRRAHHRVREAKAKADAAECVARHSRRLEVEHASKGGEHA